MLKLLWRSGKIAEANGCRARWFYSAVPLLGKADIRRTWKKNTARFLKRTEDVLSGKSCSKKKYARLWTKVSSFIIVNFMGSI